MTLFTEAAITQLVLPDRPPPPAPKEWRPPEPDGADERAVLAALRDGSTLRKEALTTATGLDERAVRAACAALRRLGWPVIASSGRAGYRLSFDLAELDRLEKDISSRALALLRTRRMVRQIRQRRLNAA